MSATGALGEAVAARIDPDDPATVRAALADVGTSELRRLGRATRHLVDDDDVTAVAGDGEHRTGRWRLDPLPMVLGADEWAELEAGLRQRTELLDLVLADVYGPRNLVRSGQLPPEVVFGHPGFLHALDGVRHPGTHQLTLAATDLLRDATGRWLPVADRTDVPTGAVYALENRSVLSRLLPELHRAARVERLAPYARALRSALWASVPTPTQDPRVAVLSGGADAFEHGNLAALLGHPLVEGPDLSVRDGRVWLRSLGGRAVRIDVLLRRVPSAACDPLELRAGSTRGTAGLVEAVRRGGVAVANRLGSGVLDNTGLQAFLPDLARTLLGQELRLAGPRTWWCGDPDGLATVLDRLDDLVLRPLAPAQGRAVVPATSSAAARDELRARLRAQPHRWVGQERIEVGTERSLAPDGHVAAGRVELRTFAVAHGEGYAVMRGGLARVSAPDGPHTPPWSKDVWVLGGAHEADRDYWLHRGPPVAADAPESVVSARTVENMLWLGRYAERAEAIVRLLRAIDGRRSEAGGGTAALGHVVDHLLVALTDATRTSPGFHDEARRRTPGAELTALVLDGQRSGTLAFAAERLLEAARAVRDQLSGDAWPVLTSLERQLVGDDEAAAVLASGRRGPAYGRAALGHVLTPLLALQGLAAESLVRDPSWRFLEAGRRLERSQQLLALLRATVTRIGAPVDEDASAVDAGAGDDAVTALLLESVLVTCESIITYRRRYRSRAQLATVLDLLLRDPTNPRSLRWQLDRLLDVLPAIEPGDASPVTDAVRTTATALRTAALDDLDGPGLAALLDRLGGELRHAGTELARTVFVPPPQPRPMVEERAVEQDGPA